MQCFDKIGAMGCAKIFRDFYAISTKDLQDAHLYGLLHSKPVERKRPRSGEQHGKGFSYIYQVNNLLLLLLVLFN